VQQAIDLLCKRAAGGCVIAVAPGQLDSVLQSLIEQKPAEICLCLLPGEHKLAGEVAIDNNELGVTISGCGSYATRLLVTNKPFNVRAQSFILRQLTLIGGGQFAPILVARAQTIRLDDLNIAAVSDSPLALLDLDAMDRLIVSGTTIEAYRAKTFAGIAGLNALTGSPDLINSPLRADFLLGAQQTPTFLAAMTVSYRIALATRIKNQFEELLRAGRISQQEADAVAPFIDAASRQTLDPNEVVLSLVRVRAVLGLITPGVAVTIESAVASANFDNCEIVGLMSCYGPPGNPLTSDEKQFLLHQSRSSAITLLDTGRTLCLRNTSLVGLVIGNQMLAQLRNLLHQSGQLLNIYASALLSDCLLLTGGNFIVSRGTQTSSLRFDAIDSLNTVANVVGDYASFVGLCYSATPPPGITLVLPLLFSFTNQPPVQAGIFNVIVHGP
jgi:hypothetical protein